MAAEPLVQTAWLQHREEDAPLVERRATDATKLTLPLPVVIGLVIAMFSIAGSVLVSAGMIWKAQADLQSDVRVILVQMAADKQVAETNAKMSDSNMTQMKGAIEAMSRRSELQQMQIAEMQKSIALLTAGRK